MKVRYDYLKDSAFLEEIDKSHLKEQYAKITFLDWKENPIQEIQTLVTNGTINIDGSSSVRRTCNLTVYIPSKEYSNITNINNLFSINKKMYLEIGYKNTTNKYSNYDIIWFPQGLFVINGCSISHQQGGVSVNLSMKDKMCLLNGDCGGVIPAQTQFDQYDTLNSNGEYVINKPTIAQIIRELVNHMGNEQLGKIIISDIDSRIKQVVKWTGSNPVYLYHYTEGENSSYILTTNYATAAQYDYQIFSYGEDIGFIYTDFTYPTELIANTGETICSVLDKIKSTLGNYEYFYDIDGNFVFQEIKNYLNISQSTLTIENLNNKDYLIDISKGKSVYDFTNSPLVISYSNSPNFTNVKNDYVVWGIRKNAAGNDIPIRYHLAIDTKPKIGNDYEVYFYEDPEDGLTKAKCPIRVEDYSTLIEHPGIEGEIYLVEEDNDLYIWNVNTSTYDLVDLNLSIVRTTDWRSELYLQGVQAEPLGAASNYYFTELQNEWPKLYDLQKNSIVENGVIIYTGGFRDEYINDPSSMDYYLDFIDTNSKLAQFNIDAIGRRSKVENINEINCIFEPVIPDLVIIENGQPQTPTQRAECEARNQEYTQVEPSIFASLGFGGSLNGAFEEIKNLLYQHTGYNESIQLTTMPIYHLEPNTRVTVKDEDSDINGDYMINTISIPLGVDGTMNITATRVMRDETGKTERVIPEEYTQINYIQSNGNQYINTRILPTNTMSYIYEFEPTNVSGSQYYFGSRPEQYNIGAWGTGGNTQIGFVYNSAYPTGTKYSKMLRENNNYYRINYSLEKKQSNDTYRAHIILSNLTKSLNEEIYTSYYAALTNVETPLYVGGVNPNGHSAQKIYKFKIYDNNILIHNFIPCYRNRDNKPGLYNTINNTFYTNAGSGEFTYGI